MQDFRMEGISKISGGEFGKIKIEGVGTCSNHIKANELNVEGVFNCTGVVEADYFYCGGVANFKADIRAKKISVEGVISEAAGTKIEAGQIVCDGVIKTGGEISADFVNAEGCIEADEIVGDRVIINSHSHARKLVQLFNRIHSKARLIEATTIEISGVTADTVNGSDITIGPNCTIENIDCSGVLSIDRSSFVRNITGNYMMRDK